MRRTEAIVFENLAHPFAQRIQYRRTGATSMLARIEGMRGDQVACSDFPMRRVACGPPA